ncbi:Uncharacterized protein PHSC3_000607 [Chlamydiales bacterium STE3]|nr:Uncharacterized protein PHSC3_000607 [Chlamydiales bacterium STE3]
MISRIAFIVNYNQYESKFYFTKRLAEALERLGVETAIIELERGKWSPETYRKIRLFDPDFSCSFNSFLSLNGVYPWDLMQLPHLAILLDPAFYSADFIKSRYVFLSSVDKQDCQWFQENHFRRIFFWPHAVEKMELEKQTPRPYDVVFLGTFTDFQGIKMLWEKELSPPLSKVLSDAAERVLSDNRTSLTQALADSFQTSGLDPQEVDFKRLFYFLDNYTRGRDRFEAINQIKNAQVHIFGEPSWNNPFDSVSWSSYLGKKANVTIHPPLTYADSFNILKQSKICLNSMPFFKYGSHERIFNALACGALPLTMDNLFIQEAFEVDKELATYTSGQWAKIDEQVEYYLSHEEERVAVVHAGREKVMQLHTWDNRAQELLNEAPKILSTLLPPD